MEESGLEFALAPQAMQIVVLAVVVVVVRALCEKVLVVWVARQEQRWQRWTVVVHDGQTAEEAGEVHGDEETETQMMLSRDVVGVDPEKDHHEVAVG